WSSDVCSSDLPSESITRMFEEIQESSRRAAEEVVKARGAIMGFGVPGEGAGGGAAEAEEEEWRKRFERILSRFDTEQQALRDHQVLMSDLNRAWREGEFETEERVSPDPRASRGRTHGTAA